MDAPGTLPLPGNLHHPSQPGGRGVSGCSLFLSFNSSVDLPAPYSLQEVEVGIINTTMCDYMYTQPSYRYNIWGDMICAGHAQGGRDACFVSVPPHPNQSLLGPIVSHQPSPRPERHLYHLVLTAT